TVVIGSTVQGVAMLTIDNTNSDRALLVMKTNNDRRVFAVTNDGSMFLGPSNVQVYGSIAGPAVRTIGFRSGANNFLYDNLADSVALGINALQLEPGGAGNFNTAMGSGALSNTVNGTGSSAFGYYALRYAEAVDNSAFGILSQQGTTSGKGNSSF